MTDAQAVRPYRLADRGDEGARGITPAAGALTPRLVGVSAILCCNDIDRVPRSIGCCNGSERTEGLRAMLTAPGASEDRPRAWRHPFVFAEFP